MTPFEPFKLYWQIYGGLKAFFESLYMWISVIITVICSPLWLRNSEDGENSLVGVLLSIVPSLMAFTLAGMAIVLTVSGDKFTKAIREGGSEQSLFMKTMALFFHFIIIQVFALIMILITASYPNQKWLAAIAFFLTAYGVGTALSIAAMLLNISRIYNFAGDDEDGA